MNQNILFEAMADVKLEDVFSHNNIQLLEKLQAIVIPTDIIPVNKNRKNRNKVIFKHDLDIEIYIHVL